MIRPATVLCNLAKVSCKIRQFAKVDCSGLQVGDEEIGVHGRGHPDRWLAVAHSSNSLQSNLETDTIGGPFSGGGGKRMISVRPAAPTEPALFQAQKVYGKWCRNEALCGNPLGMVFRTCWSATCASPAAAAVRFWTCGGIRFWPPGLMRVTYLKIGSPGAGVIVPAWPREVVGKPFRSHG